MEMVNGYVFLDLTKANVYSKALKVLGTDKPVVIKDGSGSPYFVDSLTLDGTNVVITKGGKTITIANDNTITNVGDIQNHLYLNVLQFELNDDALTAFIVLNIVSSKKLEFTTLDEFKAIISEYYGKGLNGYCEYDNHKYTCIVFEDGLTEINLDNGSTTSNEIETISNINNTYININ